MVNFFDVSYSRARLIIIINSSKKELITIQKNIDNKDNIVNCSRQIGAKRTDMCLRGIGSIEITPV